MFRTAMLLEYIWNSELTPNVTYYDVNTYYDVMLYCDVKIGIGYAFRSIWCCSDASANTNRNVTL